tara:strand:- start:1583 stop:2251 length:669 start_codon:yes stop_codon:yes gene_type:complete
VLRKDPFERVLRSDPFDNWTTITLIVVALVLSTLTFQDRGFPMLESGNSMAERPWTLFTTCLIHGTYLHLVMNLYWTWQFGRILEPSVGSLNLAWLTVVFAVGSTGISYAIEGPAIGLSGIGYAYFGFLWALTKFHPQGRALLDERITSFFVLWFFICIYLDWQNIMPIANFAHGAGAVIGVLAGWGISKGQHLFSWQRAVFLFVAILGVLWSLTATYEGYS